MVVVNLLFILTILSNTAFAKEYCFSSRIEYEAVKMNLPEVLKVFPVYLTGKVNFGVGPLKKTVATAASALFFENEDVRFFFNCTVQTPMPIETKLKRICSDGSKMLVEFNIKSDGEETFVSEPIVIESSDRVIIRGMLEMKVTNSSTYNTASTYIASKGSVSAPPDLLPAVRMGAVR